MQVSAMLACTQPTGVALRLLPTLLPQEGTMGTDCAGRHVCEPPSYPDDLAARWSCPDCGKSYRAQDAHAEQALPPSVLAHIPVGTLGWTTRGAA